MKPHLPTPRRGAALLAATLLGAALLPPVGALAQPQGAAKPQAQRGRFAGSIRLRARTRRKLTKAHADQRALFADQVSSAAQAAMLKRLPAASVSNSAREPVRTSTAGLQRKRTCMSS